MVFKMLHPWLSLALFPVCAILCMAQTPSIDPNNQPRFQIFPFKPAPDLNGFITQMAAESLSVNATDMGVKHFNWTVNLDNPMYPYSPTQLSIRIHLFVKYTHWQNRGRVKGFVMAETRDAARRINGLQLEPVFVLRTSDQEPTRQHAFVVKCQVNSYWDPPSQVCFNHTDGLLVACGLCHASCTQQCCTCLLQRSHLLHSTLHPLLLPQSAMVYGFEHSFPVIEGSKHEYDLLLDLDPTIMTLAPGKEVNQIDGRGFTVPPVEPATDAPRETVVVLKPLYNFAPAVFGPLVDRHVEYYQALGVTRHIIYLRKEQLPHVMLGHPKMARLVYTGKILLVVWNELPEHTVRVVGAGGSTS